MCYIATVVDASGTGRRIEIVGDRFVLLRLSELPRSPEGIQIKVSEVVV